MRSAQLRQIRDPAGVMRAMSVGETVLSQSVLAPITRQGLIVDIALTATLVTFKSGNGANLSAATDNLTELLQIAEIGRDRCNLWLGQAMGDWFHDR